MFAPDADVSPYSVDVLGQMEKASGKPISQIHHANTRLPEQSDEFETRQEPPSPSRSRIAAAISGTPCKRLIASRARQISLMSAF